MIDSYQSTPTATSPDHRRQRRPSAHAPKGDHLVMVLDCDASLLDEVDSLLTGKNFSVKTFQRPADLFSFGPPQVPSCLILDHWLDGQLSGLDVYTQTVRMGWNLPSVFLASLWSVQVVVEAVRNGADSFLIKPLVPNDLVRAVADALEVARTQQHQRSQNLGAQLAVSQLTQRELDVVRLICAGHRNKEIAEQLGLALVTVKVHRSRAMHKLQAGNAAELTHIATLGGALD